MGRRTCSHWLRIRADNFYLFNDLSVCHRRSGVTSTRICSLPRGKWLRIRVDVLTIRIPIFVAHGLEIPADVRLHRQTYVCRRTSGTSARIYSPCATDTGKQGELDLCRYLHICIGLIAVHRCPQLLASQENSSAEL